MQNDTQDIQTGKIIDQFDPTSVQIAKHIFVVNYQGPHEKRFDGLRIDHRVYDSVVTRYLKPSDNLLNKGFDRVYALPPLEPMSISDLTSQAMREMREAIRDSDAYLEKLNKATPASTKDKPQKEKIKTAPKPADKKSDKKSHESMTDNQAASESTGILEKHGFDMRSQGKRRYKSYFVDMKTDKLNGATVRHWGVDLKRAVKESGAKEGQRILLRFEGTVRVSVPSDGPDGSKTTQPRFKKAYTIQLLD